MSGFEKEEGHHHCMNCGGDGAVEESCSCEEPEDTCVCLTPEPRICPQCQGKGTWKEKPNG